MRGEEDPQDGMFSYISAEKRIPKDHPLRPIREMMDRALVELSPLFEEMYSHTGRPSIAPEKLLRALLLQVLYTVRSERMLMEQLDYNMLFRWFVGLKMDDEVWDPTVFTKNRDRLLAGDVASELFRQVLAQAREKRLLSDEHFTVDGTLIEAWAGQKSFKKKGKGEQKPPDDPGNPTVNFHGEKRSNQTHQSTTDPDSRLYRKSGGHEAKLSYLGHVMMENRNGLVVSSCVSQSTGTAEREAAVVLIGDIEKKGRITLGADKGYDTQDFIKTMRDLEVTPHVAQNVRNRSSAIDQRTTRHLGYATSQRKRKRVEEVFGWLKTVGLMRKTRHRGVEKVDWTFRFAALAYNLVRMRNLEMNT